LLDANVLMALSWPYHVHHAKAHEWFAAGFFAAGGGANLNPILF
jgi:hypothetical protein